MSGREKKKHRDRSRSRSRSPRHKQKRRATTPEYKDDKRRNKRERSSGDEYEKKAKKKDKELLKSMETPQEKRARRLAKKEAKDRKRRKEMGWDEDYLGYTNTDNPFGDAHLLDSFVWHKKLEKEGIKESSEMEQQRRSKITQEETRRELEKVKQRRLEREQELQRREEEKEMMQREKEADYYKEWEKQEDEFHLSQAKLRSKIRIESGRAKPIDLLGQYINNDDDDLDVKMHEPYTILVGLSTTDLEDLLEDIRVYMELEEAKNAEFWKDITVIVRDEIDKLKKSKSSRDRESRREGINESVSSDIENIFKGKTLGQLAELRKQIMKKISSGAAVDVGYWESLLKQLKVNVSKARLKERHQAMLKQKLQQLKSEQADQPEASTAEINISESDSEASDSEPDHMEPQPSTSAAADDDDGSSGEDEQEEKEEQRDSEEENEQVYTEGDLIEESYKAYEAGSFSPLLIKFGDVDESKVADPDEDAHSLEMMRAEILSGNTEGAEGLDVASTQMFNREASKGMGEDEEAFNVTVPVSQKVYLWSDKYRPRKPRFFNRVHTGYEWNKYNQTHYDSDNPPPKVVQGYKFNIFYPDLIEKTVTPQYFLESCRDTKEFVNLRFHAGPPYEDIAFKIVNREWEYSHKNGFRCQFQNNNFQLWFHFKRYRYRR